MGLVRTRPSREILSGDSADVYFARAESVLEREGLDPIVTMEVFARQDAVLCGIDEAKNLLGHVLATADPAETRVEALDDGDRIGPKEVVLRIHARYRQFGLYETAILGMLAQSTGWATAARECVDVAAPEPVISFGARHVHPDITDVLDYAAIVGGCVGASTPAGRAARRPGPDRDDAPLARPDLRRHGRGGRRRSTATSTPDVPRIVLVDTFKDEAEEALRVAHALGDRLYGIRLDTPSERGRVTADLVKEVRARLDQEGFDHVKIVVSGGLNPERIALLQGAGRAGRFVRRRVVHQRRDADRLHRRHQGDRRPADRQARPDPRDRPSRRGSSRSTSALWRDGRLIGRRSARPVGHPAEGPIARSVPPFGRERAASRAARAGRRRRARDRLRAAPARPRPARRQRHFAQAAIVLERADRDEPGKASILEALGRAYYNSGQHERSRATFEQLLEIDPSAHYAHFALGQSLKQLGRRDEARTHLRLRSRSARAPTLYAARPGPARHDRAEARESAGPARRAERASARLSPVCLSSAAARPRAARRSTSRRRSRRDRPRRARRRAAAARGGGARPRRARGARPGGPARGRSRGRGASARS